MHFRLLVGQLLELWCLPDGWLCAPLWPCRLFYMSAEDHQNVFAQYYWLPVLSLRNTLWGSVKRNESGFMQVEITPDGRHPNDRGHQCALLLPGST